MDQLFRQSGLMRAKWAEVHYADGRTYGEVIIKWALEVTDEHEPSTDSEPRTAVESSETATSVATEAPAGQTGDADGNVTPLASVPP